MPRYVRPPDRTSSDVAALTSRPGGRATAFATIGPSAIRSVAWARNPSVVYASSIGSSGPPQPVSAGSWKKWSMTHRLAKPFASAAWAIEVSVGRMAGVPPGNENDGSCSPTRMVVPAYAGRVCARSSGQATRRSAFVAFALADRRSGWRGPIGRLGLGSSDGTREADVVGGPLELGHVRDAHRGTSCCPWSSPSCKTDI